jgi:hypothetical protein
VSHNCDRDAFVVAYVHLMVPESRRNRFRPKPDRQRALALLGGSPEGVPEVVMTTAYGFTIEQLAELVQAGLATTCVRQMRGRNTLPIEVTWVTITDTGLAVRAAMRGLRRRLE